MSITVINVNDEAPQFASSPVILTLRENSPASSSAGFVLATDLDCELPAALGSLACQTNPFSRVSYRLISQSHPQLQYNTTTGEVTVLSTIDRETLAQLQLVVEATDAASISYVNGTEIDGPLSSIVTVQVQILDENDNVPTFVQSSYGFVVFENLTSDDFIGLVQASDDDAAENGTVSYAIVAGNDNGVFQVNASTGRITLTSALDREDAAFFNMTLTATDGGGNSASISVTVTVLDLNDNAPVINPNAVEVSVFEGMSSGPIVTSLRATDVDINNTIIFFISAGNEANDFVIDATTGVISVAKELDRERTAIYRLTVSATSNQSAPDRNASVRINVLDLNDSPPTFLATSRTLVELKEGAGQDTFIAFANATDPDVTPLQQETFFSIAGGNTGNTFKITRLPDRRSAFVSINTGRTLDFEAIQEFNLTLRAFDERDFSLFTEHVLTVRVQDLNDNRFNWVLSLIVVSVRENSAVSTALSNLTDFISDLDANPALEFAFSGSDQALASAFFFITPAGTITVASQIDRETTPSITVSIVATDVENADRQVVPATSASQRETTRIRFVIEDEDDNAPVFGNLSATTLLVNERAPRGFLVTQFQATDADTLANSQFEFVFLSKPSDLPFALGTDGQLRVNGTLDRETVAFYDFTVRVQDSLNRGQVRSITVELEDDNDQVPNFLQASPLTLNIEEDRLISTFIIQVLATDNDLNNAGAVRYSIVATGAAATIFSIDQFGGNVFLANTLDRETIANYSLKIRATDLGTACAVHVCVGSLTLCRPFRFSATVFRPRRVCQCGGRRRLQAFIRGRQRHCP